MSLRTITESLQQELSDLESAGNYRQRVVVDNRRPGYVTIGGQEYSDFSSNDYLGFAADPRIHLAVSSWLEKHAWGAAASPLLTGFHEPHRRLEVAFTQFWNVEAALLFESGYAANCGVISALTGPKDILFCDKRNHASLVDGCRLSGAKLTVYRTDQLEKLEARLKGATGYRRRLIITDSVFSMDGDVAPLSQLCQLANDHDALLFVDEAHALGVLGPAGQGCVAQLSLEDAPVLRMATLGKALGGVGAVVGGPQVIIDWLVNKARHYIYSTALPPAASIAALTAMDLLAKEPGRLRKLQQLRSTFQEGLTSLGLEWLKVPTPIQPILLGKPEAATGLAKILREQGYWVAAIRPPTVPTGTSRLRVSLSASHESSQIEGLLWALAKGT